MPRVESVYGPQVVIRCVYINKTSVTVLSRNITTWRVEKMIKYALHGPLPFQGSSNLLLPFLPKKKHNEFHLCDQKSCIPSHSLPYLGKSSQERGPILPSLEYFMSVLPKYFSRPLLHLLHFAGLSTTDAIMVMDCINPAGDPRVSHCTANLNGKNYRMISRCMTFVPL